MEILARRINELRLDKTLSAVKLGKALNVSDITIGRWEKGMMIPSALHLKNMAVFFNVTTDYLVGLQD